MKNRVHYVVAILVTVLTVFMAVSACAEVLIVNPQRVMLKPVTEGRFEVQGAGSLSDTVLSEGSWPKADRIDIGNFNIVEISA